MRNSHYLQICAYGPYSASATGGNGWSRDFLAGVLTVPATPFFTNIGPPNNLEYANTILFCISFVLVLAVYVVYWKGPVLRKRSPFAQQLAQAEAAGGGRRLSSIASGSRKNSMVAGDLRPGFGSRSNSYAVGRRTSRQPSHHMRDANLIEERRDEEYLAHKKAAQHHTPGNQTPGQETAQTEGSENV